MSNLIKGSFQGKPVKYEFGLGKRGAEVRIDFVIVGGELADTKVPYNGNFTEKGVKLQVRAIDPKHAKHGDKVELAWRKG